ncbi:unnamed protein product, partial [Adineta steineri]
VLLQAVAVPLLLLPPLVLQRAAAAVPQPVVLQAALLLLPPVPQVVLPLPQAAVVQVAVEVAQRLPLLVVPLQSVAVLQVPLVLLLPLAAVAPRLRPRPPLAAPLRAVAALQVAVQRVVAALRVVLPRAAAVPQVALLPTVPQVLSKRLMLKFIDFFSKLACYSPTIILIPGQSSLSSPISYRRSQDFYISSMIQFNCDGSLSTTTKWTIKNCTSTSCSFAIVLNEKVMTTFSELYIPSRTLDYGVYQLTLTVTMIDSPNLKASSSVYVRITATGITANLVQLGTSMITRGDQQDLLLD